MPPLPAIRWGLIAGIVDPNGGSRVVFTDEPFAIPANVVYAKGERAFVAPGWYPMTHEPVEVASVVVALGEKAIERDNACGTCRACCITLPWKEGLIDKPAHTPCAKLCAEGCSVYADRPKTCQRFQCLWLASQESNQPMASELRPDRCGAILTPNSVPGRSTEIIEIHPHKDHWKTCQQLGQWLDGQVEMGRKPFLVTHYDVIETT